MPKSGSLFLISGWLIPISGWLMLVSGSLMHVSGLSLPGVGIASVEIRMDKGQNRIESGEAERTILQSLAWAPMIGLVESQCDPQPSRCAGDVPHSLPH